MTSVDVAQISLIPVTTPPFYILARTQNQNMNVYLISAHGHKINQKKVYRKRTFHKVTVVFENKLDFSVTDCAEIDELDDAIGNARLAQSLEVLYDVLSL